LSVRISLNTPSFNILFMPDVNFILYLKTLKPEDWNKKATNKWTVKDVVSHMIGWEKGEVQVIKETWETKKWPWWFASVEAYDDYNAKYVEFYKNYSPPLLIAEWEKWQKKVQEQIDRIGENNLKNHIELFYWLFEGVDDSRSDGTDGHYKHHYNQIKKAVGQK
jgi:hypothetical protein